jgi:hypothetical protein
MRFDVGRNGYEREGTVNGQEIHTRSNPGLMQLAMCGVLDCNAALRDEPGGIVERGSPG